MMTEVQKSIFIGLGTNPCHSRNHQKHYWDAEKKYNCVHLNSLFILIKYVTRYVTTQVFRMWLTTFSPLIFGWTTK